MPKQKNPPSEEKLLEDTFLGTDNVSSATECTGLIPSAPGDESEAEAYTKIYEIPKPENRKPNDLQKESPVRGNKWRD